MKQNKPFVKLKYNSNIDYTLLFLFLIILGNLSFFGQHNSKLKTGRASILYDDLPPYPTNKDSLWSKMLYPHSMSKDGQWVSMTVNYPHKLDTLLLAEVKSQTTLEIPGGYPGKFSEDSKWYTCTDQDRSVWLLDLNKGLTKSLGIVKGYGFSSSSRFWLGHFIDAGIGRLEILELHLEKTHFIEGEIEEISIHPTMDLVAVIRKIENESQVVIFQLESKKIQLLKSHPTNRWSQLQWSKDGSTLVFNEEDTQTGVNKRDLHIHNLNGKSQVLRHNTIQSHVGHMGILGTELQLSNHGKAITLQWNTSVESEGPSNIEIWHTEDKWLYPRANNYKRNERQKLKLVWYPFENRLMNLSTPELPTIAWNINHPYALQFDKLQYEPLYQLYQDVDVFLTEPNTGIRQKILKKHYNGTGFITLSPTGRYIAYFSEKNWWVFDTALKKHINLTKGLKVEFEDEVFDHPGKIPPYGNPGWTVGDKFILIYDRYDIWKIKPDGSIHKKITEGRDQKRRFRMTDASKGISSIPNYPEFTSHEYDLQKGVFISTYDNNHATGYVYRNPDGSMQTLVEDNKQIDRLVASEDHLITAYRIQDYHEPPELIVNDLMNEIQTSRYKTNNGLSQYNLGRSKLIYYYTTDGDTLQGTLIYPAGYKPGKKYPLVVNIYEKMSYKLHWFNPPSEYEFTGLNVMQLALDGYAVLFPDIKYKTQSPGVSALLSVTAAVNTVIDLGVADPDAVGLVGHSFGGYETLFIATQTDMFATVIAGAAIADFWTSYWNMGWTIGEPDLWRFENHQFRMEKPIYEIPEAYFANSPINHVHNISTPIMLWSGKEDKQVNWQQSVSFYLALRKLGKKATLILYTEENHNLMKAENQKHLTQTMHDWLDKHLKNK